MVTLDIEIATGQRIKDDFDRLQMLMLSDLDSINVFFETAPFDTSTEILTMPTLEQGGLENQTVDDDLRTIRCHIENRVHGVLGLVKGHNPEDSRLYIVSEDYGIVAVVWPTEDLYSPSTYHLVGSDVLLSHVGSAVDPLQ